MKRLKIAVLFGGCSPEYSVSLQSAAAVLQNMDSSKYEAVMVGIPCALSCNHGKVLINGYEAPIIGRICMDQLFIDVTGIPNVAPGDEAVLIGSSGIQQISASDLAEQSGTISNEILSRLGSRLERIEVRA